MAKAKAKRQQDLSGRDENVAMNEAEVVAELTPAPQAEEDAEGDRIAKELLNQDLNWSQKIRYLHSEGFKNSSIAHILSELRGWPMRPQHVNNVLQRPLKGRPQRSPTPQEEQRSSMIIQLLKRPKD